MAKHGKKYLAAAAKVNPDTLYEPQNAIALVRETSISKFDGTVELHIRLGVDPRHADQQVRDVVVLLTGWAKQCACWSLPRAMLLPWRRKPVQMSSPMTKSSTKY